MAPNKTPPFSNFGVQVQVVYAPSKAEVHRALRVKAAALAEIGLEVHLCGTVSLK